MSVDDRAEHCPNCKSRGITSIHSPEEGRWYRKCDRCGERDEGFDEALAEMKRRDPAWRKRRNNQ